MSNAKLSTAERERVRSFTVAVLFGRPQRTLHFVSLNWHERVPIRPVAGLRTRPTLVGASRCTLRMRLRSDGLVSPVGVYGRIGVTGEAADVERECFDRKEGATPLLYSRGTVWSATADAAFCVT